MKTYTQDEVDDMVFEARQAGYDEAEDQWQQGYDKDYSDGYEIGADEAVESIRNSL